MDPGHLMTDATSKGSGQELPTQVEDALADALLRSPVERAQRLRALVTEHRELEPTLLLRVAELLGENEGSVASDRGPHDDSRADSAGAQLGRYTLLEQIAEGGMGTVWLAEQREPIRRRVAVKVIKFGMDTSQVMARFDAERQALAVMDHPHIAKVFDAGSTDAGRPYFVMEYIRGVPILEYCDQQKADTMGRLSLFVGVCQAIQHAHQKGVIHRDIKPSNVLVTMHDGVPVPKVIDFGIAKATSSELTQQTLFTQHRQVLGTPAYMSPEQAEMTGTDIDTRSDIYSLGVMLYELLTGTTPFDNDELVTSGFAEMVRTIREVDPPKPSARISTLGIHRQHVANLRSVESNQLGPLLRGELDWIAMKCLEKDRSRRYDTANALADDVQRHLDVEPVLACPPSARYRLRKFVRRNRGQVIASCAVAFVLLLGLVVSSIGWRWALDEKLLADEARSEEAVARTNAELLVRFMGETLGGIGPSVAKGRDTTMLREMMDRAAQRIERGELDIAPEAKARLSGTIGRIYRELAAYGQARKLLEPALTLARDTFGGDHAEVARAINSLATLEYVEGSLAAAETLHREALAMYLRLFPAGGQRVAGAQCQLAILLQARGQLPEAEGLYRSALEIYEQIFAGDHESVAWCKQALGALLSVSGDATAAEPFCRESLAMYRRLFPGDGPQVATGLGHLAIMLHGRRDLEGAEAHYRESLAMNQRLFSGDHPNVATGLNCLAMVLRDRQQLAEAARLFVESMEMSRRLFPGDQPNRAADLSSLAALYWAQSDHEKSIPLYLEALAARTAKLGAAHLDTLTIAAELGRNYLQAGSVAEAIPMLERAAVGSLKHATLLLARRTLLDVYATSGDLVRGEGRDRAVELVEILLAQSDAADQWGRGTLRYARALLGLNQWQQAESLLAKTLRVRRDSSPNHWGRFHAESLHGEALMELQRHEEAEPVLLSGYQGMFSCESAIPIVSRACIADARQRLVRFYESIGDEEQAAVWQQEGKR